MDRASAERAANVGRRRTSTSEPKAPEAPAGRAELEEAMRSLGLSEEAAKRAAAVR